MAVVKAIQSIIKAIMPSKAASYALAALFAVSFSSLVSTAALADTFQVNDVLNNMIASGSSLPGLVTAAAYLLGILLAALGVLKAKEHVENPSQTPLRTPVIRFLVAGGLFAFPFLIDVVVQTFNAGVATEFDPNVFTITGTVSGLLGTINSYIPTGNLNNFMTNLVNATSNVPGMITALAYLLGLIILFAALLKTKEHVENPDQVTLKEPVVRYLTAGALLAVPTVYEAIFSTVGNSVGIGGILGDVSALSGAVVSKYGGASGSFCSASSIIDGVGGWIGDLASKVLDFVTGGDGNDSNSGGGSANTLGSSICMAIFATMVAPALLNAVAYVAGLVLGFWGVLKLRDHVLNPQQTSVWDGAVRLIAGGMFFALPVVIESVRGSVTPVASTAVNAAGTVLSALGIDVLDGMFSVNYNETAPDACNGLDGMFFCMMADITGPLHSAINFFSLVAGSILIFIGISRLLKQAQDGPRAPGGFGTIMTFIVGGILISYNEFVGAFTTSIFGLAETQTYAVLAYTDGMTNDETKHVYNVISAMVKFMIVVGLISFVRGLFIIRGVAEGNSQASLMSGATHLVGGALAINIGPLINAVQYTLGIAQYGIVFS